MGMTLLIVLLILMSKQSSEWSWVGFIFLTITLLFFFASIYGCILLRIAVNSKSLVKISRCILIFKVLLILSIIFFLANFASDAIQKELDWDSLFTNLMGPIITIINLITALYVKKVLMERDVFKQVSSYQ